MNGRMMDWTRAGRLPRLALMAPLVLGLIACDGEGAAQDAGTTDPDGSTPPPAMCSEGPLAEPIPGCAPTTPASTGDPAADCVNRINQFRLECQCLPPLERWSEGEACADQHAEYDSEGRAPHSGFRDGICANGGSGQNECPGWGGEADVITGCLQLMWDEGPGEPFLEHGHYLNMSSTDYARVACGFHTTPGGDVWAVQNFQ